MENLEIPLYSNSCGKIFNDRLIFASAYKENVYYTKDISHVKTRSKFGLKSVATILLPFSLLLIPYFDNNLPVFMEVVIVAMMVLFFVIALIKTDAKYYIILHLKNGQAVKIRISKNNKKEAYKFLNAINEHHFKPTEVQQEPVASYNS